MKSRDVIRTRDGEQIPVSPEGSLGLLASGYRGLMLWRKVRAESGWTARKAVEQSRSVLSQNSPPTKS